MRVKKAQKTVDGIAPTIAAQVNDQGVSVGKEVHRSHHCRNAVVRIQERVEADVADIAITHFAFPQRAVVASEFLLEALLLLGRGAMLLCGEGDVLKGL